MQNVTLIKIWLLIALTAIAGIGFLATLTVYLLGIADYLSISIFDMDRLEKLMAGEGIVGGIVGTILKVVFDEESESKESRNMSANVASSIDGSNNKKADPIVFGDGNSVDIDQSTNTHVYGSLEEDVDYIEETLNDLVTGIHETLRSMTSYERTKYTERFTGEEYVGLQFKWKLKFWRVTDSSVEFRAEMERIFDASVEDPEFDINKHAHVKVFRGGEICEVTGTIMKFDMFPMGPGVKIKVSSIKKVPGVIGEDSVDG